MLKFIPAGTLKKAFEVFGHFYSIDLKTGDRIDCRSVLEIVTRERKPVDIDTLSRKTADAVFIMMNPGSSCPLEAVDNDISSEQIGRLKMSLVPTKPDTTQYQVMRLMHYCDWSHVRVLNISDMRDPKSGKFIERYKEIEGRTGFTAHSLFSDERTHELNEKLNRKINAPVVCAWGVSSDLDPLIERCLSKVSQIQERTGLLKKNTDNKYFHPLPTLQKYKEKWINNIFKQMNS